MRAHSVIHIYAPFILFFILLSNKAFAQSSISINNGAKFINSSVVTLSISDVDRREMMLSNSFFFEEANWQPFQSKVEWDLGNTEGMREVFVKFKKVDGSESEIFSAQAELDTSPPYDCYVEIGDGNYITQHSGIPILLEAKQVWDFMISNRPDFQGAKWNAYKKIAYWEFPPEDGTYEVYVKFRDRAGNETDVITDKVKLDTEPPTFGDIQIYVDDIVRDPENNHKIVNRNLTVVDLEIEAKDAQFMRISNTSTFVGVKWQFYEDFYEGWKLAENHFGDYTVYIQFRDVAGNESRIYTDQIFVDTHPPISPLVRFDTEQFINYLDAPLTISCRDAKDMILSEKPDFSDAEWEPYDSKKTFQLSGKNGEKKVYAKFRDLPGNETLPVYHSVMLDTIAPDPIHILLNGGATETNNAYVDVEVLCYNALFMQVSDKEDFTDAKWQFYDETPFRVQLPELAEKNPVHIFYARFKDEAGNTTGVLSDTIEVEIYPARTKIDIDHDQDYVSSADGKVELDLYAVDATEMMVSNHEDFRDAEWEPFTRSKEWFLDTESDGLKYVFARFKSKTQALSDIEYDGVYLDRQPPTDLTMLLNYGDSLIDQPFVHVSINATDAHFMQISEDSSFSSSVWKIYNATPFNYNLREVTPGYKTLYARFKDLAGNVSEPVSEKVKLIVEPSWMKVSIDEEALTTNDPDKQVFLSIYARHATEMMISNFADFHDGVWEPYYPKRAWKLAGEDGYKEVFVKFRSETGTESDFASDGIRLDRQPPFNLGLVLNDGHESVYSLSVKAQPRAEGAAYMKVSHKEDLTNVRWVGYSPVPRMIDFPADEVGLLKVYAQFKDVAGNVSDTLQRVVLLEEIANVNQVGVAGNVQSLNEAQGKVIDLYFQATNASQMMVSNFPSFPDAQWIAYQDKLTWELLDGDGLKTVFVKFKSTTDEESPVYTTSLTVDTTPPKNLKLTLNEGRVNSLNHYINVQAFATGASAMKVSRFEDFRDTFWEKYTTAPKSIELEPGSGFRKVYLQTMDLVGNTSEVISDSVMLELPVYRESVSIDDGADYTKHPQQEVVLKLYGLNAAEMKVSNDLNFTNVAWEPFKERKVWKLEGEDALKTVYVKYRSRTLTESKLAYDEIVQDRIPPEHISIEINEGARKTLDPEVRVVVKATGAHFMQVSTRPDFKGARWRTYTDNAIPAILSSGGGEKLIYVRLKDKAGNISLVSMQSILLETTPVRAVVEIDNQLEYTNNPDRWVTLSLFCIHAKEVMVGNTPDFSGSSWQPYQRRMKWQLSGPDGYKKVYVKYRSETATESKVVMDEIMLDRVPPKTPFIVLNGGSDITQSPIVKASLKAIDADKMQVSIFEDMRNARWIPYTEVAQDISLGKRGGRQAVYARFKDLAGNITKTVSRSILLQITPLAGSVIVDNDNTHTSHPEKKVQLQILAKDAEYMMVSNFTDFSDAEWEPYKRYKDWTLEGEDGSKTIYVKFRSATYNESGIITASIILDRSAPQGSYFTINEGEQNTLSNQLELFAFAEGATEMQISTFPDFQDARWQKYENRPFKFVVDANPGKKDVYVRFRDSSGNVSEPIGKSIILEETPTTGALTIDGGKRFANDPNKMVTLYFTSQNIAEMKVSNAPDLSSANWEPFQKRKEWELAGDDGEKTVYVQLKSSSGIVSETISASIFLDRTAPFDCDIIVDNGRKSTIEPFCEVEAKAKEALFMRMGTTPDFLGAIWKTYDTKPVKVKLPPNPGKKTIYAQFRDQAGNLSPVVTKEIVLEVTPVSKKIEIDGGNDFCTHDDRLVDLVLEAKYATEMIVGNDELFSGSNWRPFQKSIQWKLSEGDGVKTVYVKYRNDSGIESGQKFDRIVLDLTPPQNCSITLSKAKISQALYPNDVEITANATEASFMQISEHPDFENARWIPYTNLPFNQTLDSGPGQTTVYARFKDKAGNVSPKVSAVTTISEKMNANNVVIINNGKTYTFSEHVFLNLISEGASHMRVSNSPIADQKWEPFSFVYDWKLEGEDGIKTVYAQFKNEETGMTSSPVSTTIILDRKPPQNPSITVKEGKYCTKLDRTVTLQVQATEAAKMLISNRKSFVDATWVDYQPTVEKWQLDGEDGPKRIYVMFSDEAGNHTEPMYVEVILDRVGPSEEFLQINNREIYANKPTVNLTIGVNNGTQMLISNTDSFEASDWEPFRRNKKWKLDDTADGEKTVYVKFRNEAGIESAVVTARVILDTTPPDLQKFEAHLIGFGESNNNVMLLIEATEAKFMRISTDGSFDNMLWEPYFPTKKIEFEKKANSRFALQLKDAAENISESFYAQLDAN